MIGVQIGTHRAWPASLDLVQHADRRADLSRRTVAALECVVRNERLLEGMQGFAIYEPLNGDDLGVLMRDGEREATVDTPTIEQDGTGTALPVVTALLGTGESETFAQRIQERRPGIDEKPVRCPVHAEGDLKVHSLYFSFVPLHEYTPLYLLHCLWTAGADPHDESVGYCRALIHQRVVDSSTRRLALLRALSGEQSFVAARPCAAPVPACAAPGNAGVVQA